MFHAAAAKFFHCAERSARSQHLFNFPQCKNPENIEIVTKFRNYNFPFSAIPRTVTHSHALARASFETHFPRSSLSSHQCSRELLDIIFQFLALFSYRLCSSPTESISTADKRDIDSYAFYPLDNDLSARLPLCMCTPDCDECFAWRNQSSHRSCKFRNAFLSSHSLCCAKKRGNQSASSVWKCVNYPCEECETHHSTDRRRPCRECPVVYRL